MFGWMTVRRDGFGEMARRGMAAETAMLKIEDRFGPLDER